MFSDTLEPLYVNAPKLYQQGQLVICCDEKTGMQILERKHATQQAEPGKPRRREYEYTRHGTRALDRLVRSAYGRSGVDSGHDANQRTTSSPIFATPSITSPQWTATIGS